MVLIKLKQFVKFVLKWLCTSANEDISPLWPCHGFRELAVAELWRRGSGGERKPVNGSCDPCDRDSLLRFKSSLTVTRQMRLMGAGKGRVPADGAGHTYAANAASVLSVDTIEVPQERVFHCFPQIRNAFDVTRKRLMVDSALCYLSPFTE